MLINLDFGARRLEASVFLRVHANPLGKKLAELSRKSHEPGLFPEFEADKFQLHFLLHSRRICYVTRGRSMLGVRLAPRLYQAAPRSDQARFAACLAAAADFASEFAAQGAPDLLLDWRRL